MYNPENFKEKECPTAGSVVDAIIVEITDGIVEDFVKSPEDLKKFKNSKATAIHVESEGRFDSKVHKCETLFTYENNSNDVMSYDARSNMGSFKKLYNTLPKVGVKVKHIANEKGYFKLMVKV